VQISDPIGTGFITNLARPDANITGFTNFESSMVGKWVELLKEMAPGVSRVAFLFNPQTAPYVARYYQGQMETSARSLGLLPHRKRNRCLWARAGRRFNSDARQL